MSKKQQVEIQFEVFENLVELPAQIQELMNSAKEAREHAYAPYSQFQVGAAILLDSGEITIGSNQENAAYPSGLCAERVAIFHCGAVFPNNKIQAMAITARSHNHELKEPIGSCGACRQSMAEYEQKQSKPIAVYFMGETGKIVKVSSVADLLPFGFDSKYL
ncbi:cytidine deaminase [Aequorivita sp. H23M31]|uniref:Cytidine deaminase n=1 Tax=Aequorivita ciconiae TaxID=2494375 RepID=A0A410G3C3_9FLAO|nr:cytidine deaminase [Aequorivita sp. H23M31]QAA81741.1 cytidine deaminase [Aequorivita sp. H23M31]